ncbi:MAG: hypothetical protein P8Y97_08925 [Candidatus Lokiarchaeota archaeon]
MKTKNSKKIIEEFHNHEPKYRRENREIIETFKVPPNKIFPLLCPVREADWIPEWDCELIYTDSGYAEEKCVFRTKEKNFHDRGTWTFTDYKKNEYVKYVELTQDIIKHGEINLIEKEDGGTIMSWKTTLTALSEIGNEKIEKILSNQDRHPITELLRYYLKHRKAKS